jgi:hypothetical protein
MLGQFYWVPSLLWSDRQHGHALDRSSTSSVFLFLVTFSPTNPAIVSHTCVYVVFVPLIWYVKTIDKTDEFGIRIESVLVVRSVQTKHTDPDKSSYGFERLTCMPIQTRMVLEHLLAKEEKSVVAQAQPTAGVSIRA